MHNSETPPHPDISSSMRVGQLVYTSFQNCGFKMLVTPKTPIEIQRSLISKIVANHWDPHNPPAPDYRAAYLFQSSTQFDSTVFGWLYYDGHDEFGRPGIPYFIAYYLLGTLDLGQLETIFRHLEQGPVSWIDRQLGESHLDPLTISSSHAYIPTRQGVSLSDEIWQQSCKILQSQGLIDWFIPQRHVDQLPTRQGTMNQEGKASFCPRLNQGVGIGLTEFTMNTTSIEAILHELVDSTLGIQGGALVSLEGQPIISTIDLDDNTAKIIAGMMLYLAQGAQKEFDWEKFDSVTVGGADGYVLLNRCQEDTFLLIKSEKVPMGLLEGAINRCLHSIRVELGNPVSTHQPPLASEHEGANHALLPISKNTSQTNTSTTNINVASVLDDASSLDEVSENPLTVHLVNAFPSKPVDSLTTKMLEVERNNDSEVTYRGRPAHS